MKAETGENRKWVDATRDRAPQSWGVNTPHMDEQATQYTFEPNIGEDSGQNPNYGLHMMNTNKSITETNLMDPYKYTALDEKIRILPRNSSLTIDDEVWNRKIKMARIALKNLNDKKRADIVDIVNIKSVSGIYLTPIFDSACQHTTDGRGTLTRGNFYVSPLLPNNPNVNTTVSPHMDSQQQFGDDSDDSDENHGGKRRTKKVRNTRKKSTRRTTKRRTTKRKKKNKPKKKTRHRKR
jgi:hypothetical protein